MPTSIKCKSCGSDLDTIFDFGSIPLVNAFSDDLKVSSATFPMKLCVCDSCFLCQLEKVPSPDLLYSNYKHSSKASLDNLKHLKDVSDYIKSLFQDDCSPAILEIGCNDGSLLNFLKEHSVDVIGIDPAVNFTEQHEAQGLTVLHEHYSKQSAQTALSINGRPFDLIVGLNVFAHFESVPEMLNYSKDILSDKGFIYFEVAYALDTIFSGNFDTVYHEHVFNWTAISVHNLLKSVDLFVIDIRKIHTQGGSLGVLVSKNNSALSSSSVNKSILDHELNIGMGEINFYQNMKKDILQSINKFNASISNFLNFEEPCLLLGSPARGVVVTNTTILKDYTRLIPVDDTLDKHNTYFPGLENQIISWEQLAALTDRPQKAILLSWNYAPTMLKKAQLSGFKGEVLQLSPSIIKHTIS